MVTSSLQQRSNDQKLTLLLATEKHSRMQQSSPSAHGESKSVSLPLTRSQLML